MNYPEKCPSCGARDIDVQVKGWLSVSNGTSNGYTIDYAGYEDFEGAWAECPTCHHQWQLEPPK